jgi:hypothetical protein
MTESFDAGNFVPICDGLDPLSLMNRCMNLVLSPNVTLSEWILDGPFSATPSYSVQEIPRQTALLAKHRGKSSCRIGPVASF